MTIGTQSWGTGSGRSKKEAEQSAAADAMERIQSNDSNLPSENDYTTLTK